MFLPIGGMHRQETESAGVTKPFRAVHIQGLSCSKTYDDCDFLPCVFLESLLSQNCANGRVSLIS